MSKPLYLGPGAAVRQTLLEDKGVVAIALYHELGGASAGNAITKARSGPRANRVRTVGGFGAGAVWVGWYQRGAGKTQE